MATKKKMTETQAREMLTIMATAKTFKGSVEETIETWKESGQIKIGTVVATNKPQCYKDIVAEFDKWLASPEIALLVDILQAKEIPTNVVDKETGVVFDHKKYTAVKIHFPGEYFHAETDTDTENDPNLAEDDVDDS